MVWVDLADTGQDSLKNTPADSPAVPLSSKRLPRDERRESATVKVRFADVDVIGCPICSNEMLPAVSDCDAFRSKGIFRDRHITRRHGALLAVLMNAEPN